MGDRTAPLAAGCGKLQEQHFFGVIETRVEKGRIVRMKKRETLSDDGIKGLIEG